jgi:hypothetical protein
MLRCVGSAIDTTLNLSFRDVIHDNDSHTLTISGDGLDTLNLTSFVLNDSLNRQRDCDGVGRGRERCPCKFALATDNQHDQS